MPGYSFILRNLPLIVLIIILLNTISINRPIIAAIIIIEKAINS
jgi:hypothetical protein